MKDTSFDYVKELTLEITGLKSEIERLTKENETLREALCRAVEASCEYNR